MIQIANTIRSVSIVPVMNRVYPKASIQNSSPATAPDKQQAFLDWKQGQPQEQAFNNIKGMLQQQKQRLRQLIQELNGRKRQVDSIKSMLDGKAGRRKLYVLTRTVLFIRFQDDLTQ
jgi:hypothetical protein